jgi:hypothetical protein
MPERFRSLYPHYDVLAKWDTPSWNEQTRKVIAKRLNEIPPRRFFTEQEWVTLAAVCTRVVPQPERADPVPIAPWIDARLHADQGSGTRYADLPPERKCWQLGLAAIDSEASQQFGRAFAQLAPDEQDTLLHAATEGETKAHAWRDVPAKSFMRHVLLRAIVEIYYAHPAAWSEIGFGGPASPRGYVRLGANRRDPWEGEEEDDDGPVHEARR